MSRALKNIVLILMFAATACASMLAGYVVYTAHLRASNAFVRNRVVMILNDDKSGQCTGVEVQAPSHRTYILTAGHCFDLLNTQGTATVTLESGAMHTVKFIAADGASDLMLLTSPETTGVLVAKDKKLYEKIHAITHGGGMPAYRTDGELLDDHDFLMPMFLISSPELLLQCVGNPANTAIPTMFGLICAIMRHQTVGTAAIVPGSSGGPILNESGSLVGIVSALGGGFNYYVRLKDIQAFLKGR